MRISHHIDHAGILPVHSTRGDGAPFGWPLAASIIVCLSWGVWAIVIHALKFAWAWL